MMKPLLTRQRMASLAGLSVQTMRYYEHLGLIDPPAGATSGRHRFKESDLAWLEFLARLRTSGMSIREMRRFADLRRRGDRTIGARQRLLAEHARTVERTLAALQENLRIVRQKIDYFQALEAEDDKA